MRHPVVFSLVLLGAAAWAAPAHAGGPRFEFLCGTYVDGDIVDVLPSARKPRIATPIACALRVTDAPADFEHEWQVELTFTRHSTVPNEPVSGSRSGAFVRDDDGALRDVEWVVTPDEKTPDGTPFFAPCQDFDIDVQVFTDQGDHAFQKTIKVQQRCPRPRPLAAKVLCQATAQDGTVFPIPGRRRGRYGADSTMRCTVVPAQKRLKVGPLAVTGHIEHPDPGGQRVISPTRDAEVVPRDEGTWLDYAIDFDPSDWLECGDGAFVIEARNEQGGVVLAKKIPFRQSCPD